MPDYPEPKWLSDVTTVEQLLLLPEVEHERWEACPVHDTAWFPMAIWQNWTNDTVVCARRRPRTVTIEADALALLADQTEHRHNSFKAPCPGDGCPDLAAIAAARAALDGAS